jgi:hypothetical protein
MLKGFQNIGNRQNGQGWKGQSEVERNEKSVLAETRQETLGASTFANSNRLRNTAVGQDPRKPARIQRLHVLLNVVCVDGRRGS